jgi:hypothetical protein
MGIEHSAFSGETTWLATITNTIIASNVSEEGIAAS